MNLLTIERIDQSSPHYDRVYFEQPIVGFSLIDELGYLVQPKSHNLRIGSRITLIKDAQVLKLS
jgi:hypothetical protein